MQVIVKFNISASHFYSDTGRLWLALWPPFVLRLDRLPLIPSQEDVGNLSFCQSSPADQQAPWVTHSTSLGSCCLWLSGQCLKHQATHQSTALRETRSSPRACPVTVKQGMRFAHSILPAYSSAVSDFTEKPKFTEAKKKKKGRKKVY